MQIVVDNLAIEHTDLSPDKKETILILHGWGRNHKEWIPIATKLSKTNRVVVPDLPGFGNSLMPEDISFDIYDYANVIKHFIEKKNIKTQITIIGHSFGGKIATILAAKKMIQLKKLVLVDSSGIQPKNIRYRMNKLLMNLLKCMGIKKMNSFIKIFVPSNDYKQAGTLLPTFKKIVKQHTDNILCEISAPTVIMWGENDNTLFVSDAIKLRSGIKKSVLRIIWKAKHDPHMSHEQNFLNILHEEL